MFKISGVFFVLVLGCGCGVLPKPVHSVKNCRPDQAVVLFALRLSGEPGTVHLRVGKDNAIIPEFVRREFVFQERWSVEPGQLPLDTLVAVSVPEGDVLLELMQVGTFWNFAGGRPMVELTAAPRTVYYLGTLEITYSPEDRIVVTDMEHDTSMQRGINGPSTLNGPERRRYLISSFRVLADPEEALKQAESEFGMGSWSFENRASLWNQTENDWLFFTNRVPIPVVGQ